MKNIVYATDCSYSSGSALRYAYRLSSAMDAKLHVLHVYDLNPFVTASVRSRGQLEQNFAREQHKVLENYCQKELEYELKSQTPHYIVKESDSVSEAILHTATELSADLVLVGMKNSQSLRGFFAGNIANDLLDATTIPLLILPYQACYYGLSTLLYATDFEEADLFALEKLTKLAAPYEALVKVVHIPKKKEQDPVKQMKRFEAAVRNKTHYPEIVFSVQDAATIESGLLECIAKEIPDMLVMLEREHPTWHDKLFHKDMVRTMENEITIPLLVFNNNSVQVGNAEAYKDALDFELA